MTPTPIGPGVGLECFRQQLRGQEAMLRTVIAHLEMTAQVLGLVRQQAESAPSVRLGTEFLQRHGDGLRETLAAQLARLTEQRGRLEGIKAWHQALEDHGTGSETPPHVM